MIYSLRINKAAYNQLRRFDEPIRRELMTEIRELLHDPVRAEWKLRGKRNKYRLRVGIYRILYAVNGCVVRVLRVEKRGAHTYRGFNP